MATFNALGNFLPYTKRLVQEYWETGTNYVHEQLCGKDTTNEMAFQFPVWDKDNILQFAEATERAPGDDVDRFSLKMHRDSSRTSQRSVGYTLPDEVASEHRDVVDLATEGIKGIVNGHRFTKERIFHDELITIANAATVGTLWTDPTSDIKGDAQAARRAMYASTGLEPNTLTITKDMAEDLEKHPQIISDYRGTVSAQLIGIDEIRRFFKVDRVVIANRPYASNNEGQALTVGNLWEDSKAYYSYSNTSSGSGRLPNAYVDYRYVGGINRNGEQLGSFAGAPVKIFSHRVDGRYTRNWDGFSNWGYKKTGAELIFRFDGIAA